MMADGEERTVWESEWRQLEPLVVDSPVEALPEVDRLVERLMVDRGYPISVQETEARGFEEPEVVAEFLEARRLARLAEQGEELDSGELGAALTTYRSLFGYLLERPPARGG